VKALAVLAGFSLFTPTGAQTVRWPESLREASATAEENIEVTMDRSLLDFASRVLSDRNPDHVKAKRILQGLQSLYVKQLSFDRRNAYSRSALQGLRSQLNTSGWSRVAEVRSRRDAEDVEVYMKSEGKQIGGLVVIVAEPRELTVVDLIGSIRPEDLASLAGVAGIPNWDLTGASK
jgi:hypothetical protein